MTTLTKNVLKEMVIKTYKEILSERKIEITNYQPPVPSWGDKQTQRVYLNIGSNNGVKRNDLFYFEKGGEKRTGVVRRAYKSRSVVIVHLKGKSAVWIEQTKVTSKKNYFKNPDPTQAPGGMDDPTQAPGGMPPEKPPAEPATGKLTWKESWKIANGLFLAGKQHVEDAKELKGNEAKSELKKAIKSFKDAKKHLKDVLFRDDFPKDKMGKGREALKEIQKHLKNAKKSLAALTKPTSVRVGPRRRRRKPPSTAPTPTVPPSPVTPPSAPTTTPPAADDGRDDWVPAAQPTRPLAQILTKMDMKRMARNEAPTPATIRNGVTGRWKNGKWIPDDAGVRKAVAKYKKAHPDD